MAWHDDTSPTGSNGDRRAAVSRLACDRCFRRKARCDKLLPTCTTCTRADATCCYNLRQGVDQRDKVESLERRLRQVEAKNLALSRELQKARSTHALAGETVPFTDEHAHDGASGELMEDGGDSTTEHGNNNEVTKQVFSLSLNAGAQKQYLGSASGAILANLLGIHGRASHGGADSDDEFVFRRFAPEHGSNPTNVSGSERGTQPSERLARDLLAAYLSHDHICYPYTHPLKLVSYLTSLYADETYPSTHPVEVFTLDMIFAIATAQVHKYAWHVMPDAETHYERAIACFGRVLEAGGLAALQSIMLVCQYRMLSISYSTSASLWHLLGMAVRLGLEMGLHREAVYTLPPHLSAGAEEGAKEEMEIKRRCFWCLFGMDRVVSNTLGRPMAINLEEIDTAYPSVGHEPRHIFNSTPTAEEVFEMSQKLQNTAVFVHITWHRVLVGKILSSLHNLPRSRMPDAATCAVIRQQLSAELDNWRRDVATLPLPDPASRHQYERSTFKSPEWYRLLYHNCILMLYRPTYSLEDTTPTAEALEHLYDSSRQSIHAYSHLHRERRINYTWITLHSVFVVGLSYIYSVRTHFQNRRRQLRMGSACEPKFTQGQLQTDPRIPHIVTDTRACSTVLVALSERWNTARESYEVFGRLCDAVIADASEFHMNPSQSSETGAPTVPLVQPASNELPMFNNITEDDFSLFPPSDVERNYQDCFEDLQRILGSHYGENMNALLWPTFEMDINFEE